MSEQRVSKWSEEDLARFRERGARADALSDRLGETRLAPRNAVRCIARIWGIEYVDDMVEAAERVQNGGGLKAKDGVPRTLGGIFFRLVRDDKRGDPDFVRVFPPRPKKKKKAPTKAEGSAPASRQDNTATVQPAAPTNASLGYRPDRCEIVT